MGPAQRKLTSQLAVAMAIVKLPETKTYSPSSTAEHVQEELLTLLQKHPNHLEKTLLSEYNRFFALLSPEFIIQRFPQQLTRLICTHHLFYKQLARSLRLFPEARHLQIHCAPTRLQFPFGSKPVLGLILGVCPLDRYELFDETTILLATKKLIPTAELVTGSFYCYQGQGDSIRMLYVELEKKDGAKFSSQELRLLKKCLPDELKNHVEKVVPAIFMKRNEEEVMKTVLTLSQELKYTTDLPQATISLETQSSTSVVFTVVLVYFQHQHQKPLLSILQQNSPHLTWTTDRTQTISHLHTKISKEAHVLRATIPKDLHLLRDDSSVNFYLARQKVLDTLQSTLGEVRDYNGGMILRQSEQLAQLKQAFPNQSDHHLLENFFYSLSPIEAQTTLLQGPLQKLFHLCLQATATDLPKRESYFLKVEQQATHVFVMIRARDPIFREMLLNALNILGSASMAITSTTVNLQGSDILGYIYECSALRKQEQFIKIIRDSIADSLAKLENFQVLRLSVLDLPISLDPRIRGEGESPAILKMLFEGLMRIDKEGEPVYGAAELVTLSADAKTYSFKLRPSFWSSGAKVTAHDFAYAWKKILSPNFSTPFTYLFYPIKNAKNAKEGMLPLDQVGIQVLDETTLLVELEHPAPYFLELTAHSLYAPVNHLIDQNHPDWACREGADYVCNGPFQLMKRQPSQGLQLIKNPLYWDAQNIQLDQVLITQNSAHMAAQMFKNDETDWVGRPFQPWVPSLSMACPEKIEHYLTPMMLWYVFNTSSFPFHHPKLRQAFRYATDRKALIEHLSYEGVPALTPLPLPHTQHINAGVADGDVAKARRLFQEALKELRLTEKTFPPLILIHTTGELLDKTTHFLKQTWEEAFEIHCTIEAYEWHHVFDRMTQGDFQIGAMKWGSWINDPMYTLNAFKYGNDKMNFAKWENDTYQSLLSAAEQTTDLQKRQEYLAKAEAILIEEVPVLPIFHEIHQFMKKNHLQVHINKKIGMVDFRSAVIARRFSTRLRG